MKIHKKILTHYLSCTSPVDKEGYLYKKRERNLTYLRRWFVLKGNVLFYQERPGDRSLLGVVVLEGCLVQASEADGQFCFSLVFTGPGLRTYRLAADDRVSQESWISALFSASHIYLSVILKDLERRYAEAVKGKGPCDSTLSPPSPKQVLASGRGPPYVLHASSILPPDGRSNSSGSVPHGPGTYSLQAPPAHFKITNKRSPKLWPKRNAHVTPLNGPAPACGEWPLAMLDPLDFSKLHEYYGNEIRQVQADWLKKQREDQERPEDDLIDLG